MLDLGVPPLRSIRGQSTTSIQTFSYVGQAIQFSADTKQGGAAFSDQRYSSFYVARNNSYVPGINNHIIRMSVIASTHPTHPNTVYINLAWDDSGVETWE